MSRIPERILADGCYAYGETFLKGSGSLGEGIEAAYFAIHDHDGWKRGEPEAWTGEGLPPVGTVCEFVGGTHCPEDPFDKDLKEGMKVTIIAHFKCGDFTLAAFTFDPENPDRGMVQVEQANFGCFRPIRTPEQIAEEQREKEILEIMGASGLRARDGSRVVATALYEAGYRKVTP